MLIFSTLSRFFVLTSLLAGCFRIHLMYEASFSSCLSASSVFKRTASSWFVKRACTCLWQGIHRKAVGKKPHLLLLVLSGVL